MYLRYGKDYGKLKPVTEITSYKHGQKCKYKNCFVTFSDKTRFTNGYCSAHYQQFRKRGKDISKMSAIHPTSSKITMGHITAGGYRAFMRSGTLLLEHRVIMELMIKRDLCPDEIVHHKNGNKLDNHPDNLEIMTTKKHNNGKRPKDLLEYAREIIARYEPIEDLL